MILPGETLGVLGGGQLGRMFCEAARTLGYKTIVLDPDPDSPAGDVADRHLCANYEDEFALQEMSNRCAAITIEFENVPATSMRYLSQRCQVSPSPEALQICRNRIREKHFLCDHDLPTAPFAVVTNENQLEPAIRKIGVPALLKTATGGYDGKGQTFITEEAQIESAFCELGRTPCVLERHLELSLELSVVVVRTADGASCCYPVAENQHISGILDTSIVPARIPSSLARQASHLATRVADSLNFNGVLAIELFVVNEMLLINEIAPRPHNSGHYTLNATVSSQFEQQVRMLCALPPGDTALLSPAVMCNLLGDLWESAIPPWENMLQQPTAKLHLYGKRKARRGRKMGHFTVLEQDIERALRISQEIKQSLASSLPP